MTTPAITVVDAPPVVATEMRIPPAKASGYMAWYSTNVDVDGQHYWMQATNAYDALQTRDPYRCPYPLFATREEAIASCAKSLSNGGTVKIVGIDL